jgi:tetratricopeptide (TPR) repeat protein
MRLVEVSTGKDMWNEKLDGKLDDIFEMQDRLATLTAESLKLVLPHADERGGLRDLDAYEFYAKAKRLWVTLQRGDLAEARHNLEKAIELDPEYAPALAGLASSYAPFQWLQTGDPKDLEIASEYALRAVAADPGWVEGHIWLGYARWRQIRLEEALACFEKAGEVDPEEAMVPYFAGWCLAQQGDWEQARESLQRAVELEPKAPHIISALGFMHMGAGDLLSARWTLERAHEAEQQGGGYAWGGAGLLLARCHVRLGDLDAARAQCIRTLELLEQADHAARSSWRATALVELGQVSMLQKDFDAARVALDQALVLIRSQPHGPDKVHVVVQSLAGKAQMDEDAAAYDEACELHQERAALDGGTGGIMGVQSLLALGQAARTLGREDEGRAWFERARDAGSAEAVEHLSSDENA